MIDRSWDVVGRSRSMVYRGRGLVRCSSRSCGILGLTLIGDFCNVSIVSVRGVGYMLDTAVRESYRVGSRYIAGTVTRLLCIEGDVGIVVINCVVVRVG